MMPYSKNSELPESIRNALPPAAQTMFRKAFNNAHKQYRSEQRAFMVAWAAVKKKYAKGADKKWVRK